MSLSIFLTGKGIMNLVYKTFKSNRETVTHKSITHGPERKITFQTPIKFLTFLQGWITIQYWKLKKQDSPKVNHNPILWYRTKDQRPRVEQNSKTKKIVHVRKKVGKSEEESAEMNIPTSLTHIPNGTAIYKLFNKKNFKGRVNRFNLKWDYYTVQYDDNDKEELTHEGIKVYIIPPVEGDYWTAQQSGQRRSKRIKKASFTRGYAGAARAFSHIPTWVEINKQIEQEYKRFANLIFNEETGRRLEYRHLIIHPKFKNDWLKAGANEF